MHPASLSQDSADPTVGIARFAWHKRPACGELGDSGIRPVRNGPVLPSQKLTGRALEQIGLIGLK